MDGNDDILSRVLAGETRAIARLMSKVEGRPADVAAIMAEIHKHAGKAHVIGLTGVPETFVISADGEIIDHVQGPLNENSVKKIGEALKSAPPN